MMKNWAGKHQEQAQGAGEEAGEGEGGFGEDQLMVEQLGISQAA